MTELMTRLRNWARAIARDEPEHAAVLREVDIALELRTWLPVETAPMDGTVVILANFQAMCLLTRAPHVWTARWDPERSAWSECSYAAVHDNGMPTHWTTLPESPQAELEWLAVRLRTSGARGALVMH